VNSLVRGEAARARRLLGGHCHDFFHNLSACAANILLAKWSQLARSEHPPTVTSMTTAATDLFLTIPELIER
jgi:hypothetical protein